MARCPKCEKLLSSITLETISIKAKGTSWHGCAYCCPYCDAAISIAIDPVALKSDTVGEVLRGLGKG
jgi:transcription elongation factor Elf1